MVDSLRTSAAIILLLAVAVLSNVAGTAQDSRRPIPQDQRLDLPAGPKYAPGEVLVRFRSDVSQAAKQSAHAELQSLVQRETDGGRLQLVRLAKSTRVEDAVRAYRKRPEVEYAEPNYIVRALGVPNDIRFGEQWNLSNTGQAGGLPDADIDAPEAWSISTGSTGVVVVVIDTGIDYTHPDLAPNIYQNTADCDSDGVDDDGNFYVDDCMGIDVVNGDVDPMDDNGHGTHVAGIIGAVGNNGTGVSGVNWNVKLVPCKFLGQDGTGTVFGAITCLNYAFSLKNHGANVIATNNSWGGEVESFMLRSAIEFHIQHGILFVAAAGNDGMDNDVSPHYPASYDLPNIISVAATDRSDLVAAFSNVGRRSVHLGAPGQEVLSTTPGNTYAVFDGTSMAAPHVTGVAALLAAQDPTRPWWAIRNLILAGGDSTSSLSGDTLTGRRLNALGSLTCSRVDVMERLSPASDSVVAAVGAPVQFSVLHIRCDQPNGNVTVTIQPSGQTLTFLDDGVAPDTVAGDGVYSGEWTPSARGNFTLTLPNGDSVAVLVLTNYAATPETMQYRAIGGTSLDLGDDSAVALDAPFPVRYGGGSFTRLFVSSNGTISFSQLYANYVPIPFPASFLPPTLAAVWWDDLFPISGSPQNVYWEVIGNAPNRELVIEWRDVRAFNCRHIPSATVRFQAIFFEDGSDMVFNYADTVFGGSCADQDRGGRAVVGVQVAPNEGRNWGTNVSFGTPHQFLGDGSAIRWQLEGATPPANPIPGLASVSPSTVQINSGAFVLTVQGSGFVPGARVLWGGLQRATTFVSSTQLEALIGDSDTSSYGSAEVQVTVSNPAPGGGTSNALPIRLMLPVPGIQSINPTSVVAGGFSFLLTVQGSGFSHASTIRWNSFPVTTYVLSSTELGAVVEYRMIQSAGTVSVDVMNPTHATLGGGGISNAVALPIVPPQQAPNQAPAIGLEIQPTGGMPESAGGAETFSPPRPRRFLGWNHARTQGEEFLKHFARPMATAASATPKALSQAELQNQAVSGLAGNSAFAAFDARPALPAGFIPAAVAVGDFDQDTKQDWVVASAGSNELWVFLGTGDGGAELPLIVPLSGQSPISLVTADFNGDRIPDLVTGEADSQTISVLLGLGNGRFSEVGRYPVAGIPRSLVAADFDGDGIPDVFASVLGSQGSSGVLLHGQRAGILSHAATILPADLAFPDFLADSGDLDNDGDTDLALVHVGAPSEVFSLINMGGGNFKKGFSLQAFIPNFYPLAVRLGDVDEDGCLDLAYPNIVGTMYLYRGRCDGGFEPHPSSPFLATGDVNFAFELVDINGDGHLDFVSGGVTIIVGAGYGRTAGNLLSVMLGDGSGNFAAARTYRGDPSMYGLALTDLNGDGFVDVVTANQDSDTTTVFLNDGTGNFGGAQGGYIGYLLSGNTVGGVVNSPRTDFFPIDVDGDGDRDLVFVETGRHHPTPSNIVAILNGGNGEFSTTVRSVGADSILSISDFVLADFRNTGRPDFLALVEDRRDFSFAGYTFAANAGGGSFAGAKMTRHSNASGRLGVGDFNRDGKLDFVAAQMGTPNRITVFLGAGDGTFAQGQVQPFNPVQSVDHPGLVHVGDFNRDGKLDLLVWTGDLSLIGASGQELHQFFGNGDGTFSVPRVVFSDFGPHAVVDVNGDGWLDVVEAYDQFELYPRETQPHYSVHIGQADGSFTHIATYEPYTGSHYVFQFSGPLAVADFNGDGIVDIAAFQRRTANPAFPFVQIMIGKGDGTFLPTYNELSFSKVWIPTKVADVTGDGRSDLIELSSFNSSFNVLPAKAGPSLSVALVSQPVIGSQGFMRITLTAPSSSATTVTLAASDLAITLPGTVTIPAGELAQDVPFQIDSAFDPLHAFSITAQLGTETAVAYGTQARGSGAIGFQYVVTNSLRAILPGQTTFDYTFSFYSVAGYSSTLDLHCENLPSGASCILDRDRLSLPAGGSTGTSLRLASTSTLASGRHTFEVIATDGAGSQRIPLQVDVGDFQVELVPNTRSIAAFESTPTAIYELRLSAMNNYSGVVSVACSGLPSNFVCGVPSSASVPTPPNASTPFSVQAISPPAAGTYNFVVTATTFDGLLSRSTTGELRVVDLAVTPPSSASATIPVGQSAQFAYTLTSQGVADQFTFGCSNAPAGISCSFNPATLSLTANGSGSTILTVTVNARPALAPPFGLNRSPLDAPPGWLSALMGMLLAAMLALRVFAGKQRRHSLGWAFAALLVVALSMNACGGGSGSTGPPPPPPPGPPPPVTVTLTVRASSPTLNKNLGTITVTVP